jgi:hypothetical protein
MCNHVRALCLTLDLVHQLIPHLCITQTCKAHNNRATCWVSHGVRAGLLDTKAIWTSAAFHSSNVTDR